jgi:niacin transporter
MNTQNKTKNIVMAALLTALSMLITFSPFKLPVPPPFSVTLGSHVPTMIAAFINPWVTIFTVLGSCLGFWMSTGNPVIVIRAASHALFAILGVYMIKNKGFNIFLVIIATSLAHAVAEGVIAMLLTPILLPNNAAAASVLGWTAGIGTLFHHYVDCAITAPILYALSKAKLVKTSITWGRRNKVSVQAS